MVQLYHLLDVLRVVELVGRLTNQVLRQVAQNSCNPAPSRWENQGSIDRIRIRIFSKIGG